MVATACKGEVEAGGEEKKAEEEGLASISAKRTETQATNGINEINEKKMLEQHSTDNM